MPRILTNRGVAAGIPTLLESELWLSTDTFEIWIGTSGGNVQLTTGAPAGVAAQEVPSGTVNSSNTAFTLANTPVSAAEVLLFLNGVAQSQGGGADYTLSGAAITFNAAPPTGSVLLAFYRW